MSKKLREIRAEIDSIDNQVHDLLMQRASLVSSVAAAKKKDGLQIVHPAREAKMMRRLLSRHKGPLPRSTVVRIWRELISSVSLLQTGLSVVVSTEEGGCYYWDMAKNYFGSTIPMKKVVGFHNVIAEVREGESSFAVMPWPELDEDAPWWAQLFNQNRDEKLSIICALPYAQKKDRVTTSISDRAVVVSTISFMPSDDDISFIGLELSSQISRAGIMKCAEESDLKVLNLFSGSLAHNSESKIHLLEVEGFYDESSEKLGKLRDVMGDKCLSCCATGGYPVIPDIT